MEANSNRQRRSIRLKEFDYASGAAYFLTMCASDRRCIFGRIEDGAARMNQLGRIIEHEWLHTLQLRSYVDLDAFVVMPNHFHDIVLFFDRSEHALSPMAHSEDRLLAAATLRCEAPMGARSAPLRRMRQGNRAHSLSSFVSGFKSAVTRRARETLPWLESPVWQRNYYEHVIRDERDLGRIRDYVAANPSRWTEDGYHPANSSLFRQVGRDASSSGA